MASRKRRVTPVSEFPLPEAFEGNTDIEVSVAQIAQISEPIVDSPDEEEVQIPHSHEVSTETEEKSEPPLEPEIQSTEPIIEERVKAKEVRPPRPAWQDVNRRSPRKKLKFTPRI